MDYISQDSLTEEGHQETLYWLSPFPQRNQFIVPKEY